MSDVVTVRKLFKEVGKKFEDVMCDNNSAILFSDEDIQQDYHDICYDISEMLDEADNMSVENLEGDATYFWEQLGEIATDLLDAVDEEIEKLNKASEKLTALRGFLVDKADDLT